MLPTMTPIWPWLSEPSVTLSIFCWFTYKPMLLYSSTTATLAPAMLPGAKLDEFCQGFADMMVAQTAQEAHTAGRRAATTTPLEAPRG